MYDIKGKKFGKLTVVEFSHLTKWKHATWKCKCDCGREIFTQTRLLRDGSKTNCGAWCEQRNLAKKHPNWKGFGEISLSQFHHIKKDAISRGIHFDIGIEFMSNLFLKQNRRCALSNVEISMGSYKKKVNDKTASLDRIDSSLGYTVDNVQWVHKDINKMKWDFKMDRFLELVEKIHNHKNPAVAPM